MKLYSELISQKKGRDRKSILKAIENHPNFSTGELKAYCVRTHMAPVPYEIAKNSLIADGIIAYDEDGGFKIVGDGT